MKDFDRRRTGNYRSIAPVLLIAAFVAWLLADPVAAADVGPVSGQPLPVATEGGVGLLASPNSYKTVPVGAAHVFGGRRPDLFVSATHGIERGLYLYRWVRDNEAGQPVFAPPVRIAHPFGDNEPPEGAIRQAADGSVEGYWLKGTTLVRCRLAMEARSFQLASSLKLSGLPRAPNAVTVLQENDGRLDLVLACANGAKYRPPGDNSRDDYVLYDGAGVYRGQWPRSGLYRCQVQADLSGIADEPRLFSPSPDEILGFVRLATVVFDRSPSVIAGAALGNLYCFAAVDGSPPKQTLFGPKAYSLRHPTTGAAPIVYPNASGQQVDLIVGGEGALYYYVWSGRDHGGHPLYSEPQPVWQENALLYAGTLPVPNAADWDGDGAIDLIVGNSEGRVLLFKNFGTSRQPRFGIGQPLTAGGEAIHVQPGYYGIQGPFETRWGYTCPTVADWNQDGLPDLLLSSATARHEVFLNVGTRTAPRLAAARPLYCDGLELHGTWRVKPGAARIDGRMAYVIQDDANALHRYWRIDDYNLADGGALRLTSGAIITAHTTGTGTSPGQKGRGKIDIVDWNGDGQLDLLVGTAKRGSLPVPNDGLPWSRQRRGQRSLQVLLLPNVGTNTEPRYQYPRQFQFRGQDIYLGAHANSPAACALGDTTDGPNLLIGMESGRIYFFAHGDMTLRATPDTAP